MYHTITSHKNLAHPSPPTDGSHGGVPSQSSIIPGGNGLECNPLVDFLDFFLEAFGVLSESFNKILSPCFLIIHNRVSSNCLVVFWGHTDSTSSVASMLICSSRTAILIIFAASQNLVLVTRLHVFELSNNCFNPRSITDAHWLLRFLDEYPAHKIRYTQLVM